MSVETQKNDENHHSPPSEEESSASGSASVTQDKDKDKKDAGLETAEKKFNRSPRFWAIIATLCVIGLLSALENTVVTTSLPFIVTRLDLGENYIWVTNIFFLTRYVFFRLIFPPPTHQKVDIYILYRSSQTC